MGKVCPDYKTDFGKSISKITVAEFIVFIPYLYIWRILDAVTFLLISSDDTSRMFSATLP